MQNNLIKINCNLCHSNNYSIMGEKNCFQVVSCKECGLVYINPQPTIDITNKIYDEKYFSGGCNFGYQGINYLSKDNEKWFKYLPTKALIKIERLQPKKGKILDIGCAVGYFLEVARQRGWQIYGIELSEFAANISKKKLKIKIFPTLDQTNFSSNYFDAITAFEIIEHLQNPSEFLGKIYRILKIKGILALSTPNLKNAKTAKNFLDWNCLTPPEHLFYFNQNTITKILNNCGFEVTNIFYGPINPLNRIFGTKLKQARNFYNKVKPLLRPIKKLLFDLPMMLYGKISGLGEDMIVIAKKK